MSEQETPQQDPTQRRYVSPAPASAREPVSELLFQWETRHLSPLARRCVAWWRSSRRATIIGTTAALLVMLSAAAARDPELTESNVALAEELSRTRSELVARQGELELTRLELARLTSIIDHSRRHRIPADLATSIYDIASAEGVEPALAFSLVRTESGFARRAVSSAGAVGLTQVMPSTAFWMQPGLTYSELFEPDTNLRLGFRYLRMMMKQYEGDLHLALLAYNRGPGTVDGILRAGGDPSNGYAGLVRAGARLPGAAARLPAAGARQPAAGARQPAMR